MVKRGSGYLRHALYLAANHGYLHNSSFRDYIDKSVLRASTSTPLCPTV
ncbi:MAG: IS110 family transposase [Christensenellaceae bacterium]|nr:IS110 family transposase [Christensenellaceae bacterium]